MQTKTTIMMLIAAFAFGQAVMAGPMTTREKLDTIILPKVQFENAPLSMVIKYLKQRSKELDPEGKGVNIILLKGPSNKTKQPAKAQKDVATQNADDVNKAPARAKPTASSDIKVTMDFDNMPLGALIDYLCKGTGMKHRVDEHAVVVAHPNVALEGMQTRIFPVGPGFLTPKRTR